MKHSNSLFLLSSPLFLVQLQCFCFVFIFLKTYMLRNCELNDGNSSFTLQCFFFGLLHLCYRLQLRWVSCRHDCDGSLLLFFLCVIMANLCIFDSFFPLFFLFKRFTWLFLFLNLSFTTNWHNDQGINYYKLLFNLLNTLFNSKIISNKFNYT